MKKNQIILILVAIVAGLSLFIFGNTVKPKKQSTDHNHSEQGPMTGGPMMNGLADVSPADIKALTNSSYKKLNPGNQEKLNQLEANLTKAQTQEEKTVAYDAIGRFWHDLQNRLLAAYYVGQSGLLDNSEKKLTFASHLLSQDILTEKDPSVRKLMYNVADSCFMALQEVTDDADNFIDHKMLIINGGGPVMQGILQLREWSDKHPDNKRAHLILGSMSLESNQLDKAIERADKVIAMDNQNLEAYLMKAQAYEMKGDKTKAIEILEKTKAFMNNPQFSEEVDQYIKKLK